MLTFQSKFILLVFSKLILLLCASETFTHEDLNCTTVNNSMQRTHFPEIRISKFISPSLNSSDSESRFNDCHAIVPITLRYLELECRAPYPVKFGFDDQYPYITWETDTERRILNSSEEFLTRVIFYSLRVFYLENRQLTCYNSKNTSLQTTLLNIRQIDSSNDTVQLNFQKGSVLQLKPKEIVNSNRNCTIKFAFDKTKNRFYCYTTTGEIPEIIFQSCSDPVSCNALMIKSNCSMEPEIDGTRYCTEKKTCRVAYMMVDYLAAVATCVSTKDANSATIQYFYSFPINNSSKAAYSSFRYFNWNDAPPEDMLDLSDLESNTIYSGESIGISCNASYYYFSKGLRIRIKGETNNYNKEFLNADKMVPIPSTKQGTKTSLALNRSASYTETILEPGTYCITCAAPVSNSTEWVSKSSRFTVLPSQKPSIIGGNETTDLEYYPSMDIICNATGIPKPKFIWICNGIEQIYNTPMHFEITSGENELYSWSRLQFPKWDSALLKNVTCVAKNSIGNDTKEFTLFSKPYDNSFVFAALGILCVLVIVVFGLVWRIWRGKRNYITKKQWAMFMYGERGYFPPVLDAVIKVNDIVDYIPYDKSFEISRDRLILDRGCMLGVGAYGVVLKADLLNNDVPKQVLKTVAVKQLRKDNPFDVRYLNGLLTELKTFIYIGKHKHIANLEGACTENLMKGKVYIVLDLCENGSLQEYIRSDTSLHNLSESEYYSGAETGNETTYVGFGMVDILTKSETFIKLMTWALQIADAFEFLATKKVVHGDLSARNILLNKALEVKITDFGLSNRITECKSYSPTTETPLPYKWNAIECLQFKKCYLESDVWSFGITLFEILSLGEIPYSGTHMENLPLGKFLRELQMGGRPIRPSYATLQIYEVMKACWNTDRKGRPGFTWLKGFITECLQEAMLTRQDTSVPNIALQGEQTENHYCDPDAIIPCIYMEVSSKESCDSNCDFCDNSSNGSSSCSNCNENIGTTCANDESDLNCTKL